MRVLLIILGSVAILLALFAGGCSLFFAVVFLNEGSNDPYVFWPIPLGGMAFSSFMGLLGWLALRAARNRSTDGETTDGGPGPP